MSASPYRRPLRKVPRIQRRRSPWVRASLAGLVVLMLPFAWSERATCDHLPQPPVSGAEILFGSHWEPGAVFLGMLALAVGLGFLAQATRRRWLSFAAEVVAGMGGLLTFTMCLMMMHSGRDEQPLIYPAAWIGNVAAAILAFEAWWASGEALRRVVDGRRSARRLAKALAAGRGPPVRIAEAHADEGGRAPEARADAEEAEAAAELEALAVEERAVARHVR